MWCCTHWPFSYLPLPWPWPLWKGARELCCQCVKQSVAGCSVPLSQGSQRTNARLSLHDEVSCTACQFGVQACFLSNNQHYWYFHEKWPKWLIRLPFIWNFLLLQPVQKSWSCGPQKYTTYEVIQPPCEGANDKSWTADATSSRTD